MFFGVRPDGTIVGTQVGANTLESFANNSRRSSDPPVYPTIERVLLEDREVVAASVEASRPGHLVYAFGTARIRVGRTNQVMSSTEQRARLLEGQDQRVDERDRPRFAVDVAGVSRLEVAFTPQFAVMQFSGDRVANLECRIRGPRFSMEWQPASGAALEKTRFVGTFDLTADLHPDDAVEPDEIGVEIRFRWRGRSCSEIHRWPLSRRVLPQKTLWSIGSERLPPLEETVGEAAAGSDA